MPDNDNRLPGQPDWTDEEHDALAQILGDATSNAPNLPTLLDHIDKLSAKLGDGARRALLRELQHKCVQANAVLDHLIRRYGVPD